VKPSRELDALVAEKVMGLEWAAFYTSSAYGAWYSKTNLGPRTKEKGQLPRPDFDSLPAYSNDISAAWEVVEKIAPACDGEFRLERDESGQWECEIGYHVADACYPRIAKGETAPHAICLAALKAVGHE
jgi:hypothetical protein